MRKHLVIGASGQLGIELTLRLQERYGIESVTICDLRKSDDELANRSEFVELDSTDSKALRDILKKG